MRSATLILAGLILVAYAGTAHSKAKHPRPQIPAAASNLITKTTQWSAARELASLRQVMTDDFVWSFGGDEGPDNAIAQWQKDERYLRVLAQVLRLPCRSADYNGTPGVECPGRGGLSFRAWFVETKGGWKFTAFVEGD